MSHATAVNSSVFPLNTARRLRIIFNPAAGARRRWRLARVLHALEDEGATISLYETRGSGDAEAAARALDPAQFDAVVAAGGDGTINEVMNGLGGTKLPLGIVPLGTANVLANELGLPRDAASLARVLSASRYSMVAPGSANGRRFAMMAGIGFDARVVEALDLRLKRWTGKAAYVASALGVLARHRGGRYLVEIDGARHEAAAVVIAKGHFYGGRYVVAARARLEQPIFQVALFAGARRVDILRYGAALGANRIAALPDVLVLGARAVHVDGPEGERVQLDGDLGPSLPLTATIAAEPLQLLR